jgi:hypothetical protein
MGDERWISMILILMGDERKISLTLIFYVKSHRNKQMKPYSPTCDL